MIDSQDVIKILGGSSLEQHQNSRRKPTITKLDNTVISREQAIFNLLYPPPKTFKTKIIKSGNQVEIYQYEHPVKYGLCAPVKSSSYEISKEEKNKRSEEYKRRNAYKSKNKIIRLGKENFKFGDKFLTLTLDDENCSFITDVGRCNKEFALFIKRLSRRCENLKYMSRIAFQDKNGRGAVHYHILCNLPFIHYKELTPLWGFGSIDIERPESTNHIMIYITKYLTKDLIDGRLKGHRSFFYSKNLRKPTIKIGESAENLLNVLQGSYLTPEYQSEYKTDYYGKVVFTRYNLENLPAHKDQQ